MESERTARETLEQVAASMGLTLKATFVPWSKSRDYEHGKPIGKRMAQWRVTLERDGRPILTTDYGQGIGHLPAYKASIKELGGRDCIMRMEAVAKELETGWQHGPGCRPIPRPDPAAVLACLALDSSVLNHRSFEEWAQEVGYDADSRKAEATYRECLAIALKLQVGLGAANLERLQEAAREF